MKPRVNGPTCPNCNRPLIVDNERCLCCRVKLTVLFPEVTDAAEQVQEVEKEAKRSQTKVA